MGRPFRAGGAPCRRGVCRRLGLIAAALAFAIGGPAAAHVRETPDEILKSTGVDEKPGARVPLDLPFRNQDGRMVRLGDAFTGGPVVLTLNYFTCPMLCPITLRNLAGAAKSVPGLSLARDYRVVTVSIDPDERLSAARALASELYGTLGGIRDPGERWPFLFGGDGAIRALTAAVGFRYRKVGGEFAHPDVSVVLTPDGRISRYFYGIAVDPKDLRLALIEAADGRIGASRVVNRVLLYCFHYDPAGKKYALYAINIMKAGGVLTLVLLGTVYFLLWKRRAPGSKPPAEGSGR